MQIFKDMIRAADTARCCDVPILSGNSLAAQTLRQLAELASDSCDPILLTGPSGSGKRSLARAVHDASPWSDTPFIEISDNQLQDDHLSIFWTGSLYLHQIDRFPAVDQQHLLDWLDSPESRNVRLFAAMESWSGGDALIEPLRNRLSRLRIPCLALSQRKDYIPAMLQRLWADDHEHIPPIFDRESWKALHDHDWPGNFRSLKSFAAKASRLFGGRRVSADQMARLLGSHSKRELEMDCFNLKDHLAQEEKLFLIEALLRSNGVIATAASIAGLNRTTFIAKMKRHGLARI